MDYQKGKTKQYVEPNRQKSGGGASGPSFSRINGKVVVPPKQGKPPAFVIGVRG